MADRFTRFLVLLLAIGLTLIPTAGKSGVVTLCQCNIFAGGRYTEQDQSQVTYDTARRFSEWVASINPPGSLYPPIAVIGMQELMSETDRVTIEGYLEQFTGVNWESARISQGVNNTSGIGFFWRPDLVEYRPEWNLGSVVLEQIDNGYVLKFAGRLFKKVDAEEAFGMFTGKLIWDGAILGGREVTEEDRRLEAVHLKEWIRNGEPGSPGMSNYPGTTRIIASDLNTPRGSATYNEMDLEFTDPSTQYTHNSFYILTRRIDYLMWDYDAYGKQSGGFAYGPQRSPHFGSDHRAVYATVNLHTVDLTPPSVTISEPASGATVSGITRITADASDASGIMQVQFYIDGNYVWTDTVAPFQYDWDTANSSPGFHWITATAIDASSNRLKATSSPRVVWIGPAGEAPTIGYVKTVPDMQYVALSGKPVTASFPGYFYIEEPDRSAGIKVSATSSPPVGSRVNVVGRMNTGNGEREISATEVVVDGMMEIPTPVGMSNRCLGGGMVGGTAPALGLENIGLLATIWGKVTAVVPNFYVYVDDGAGLRDGYGYTGVRVDITAYPGWSPAAGKYVRATGISTTTTINGKVQRRLKIRSSADVRVLN